MTFDLVNHHFKVEFVDTGLFLFKMKISLYIRCYRKDPDDPMKKVNDPDPAGQKSANPTGSSFLAGLPFLNKNADPNPKP